MCQIIPAAPHEPLFLVRENQFRYPLTAGQVNRLLKKWTKAAGLESHRYTGHCLRRGGLNWAHQARLTGETLQILGGWGSRAYLRYIDLDFDCRAKAGKHMALAARAAAVRTDTTAVNQKIMNSEN